MHFNEIKTLLKRECTFGRRVTELFSWLPELPTQQIVDDVRIGLDETHQDLLLQVCRYLEEHSYFRQIKMES